MSTGIQWTDETWNPVVGCNQVSPGCDNCYAKTLHDKRHKAFLAGKKMAPQYAEPFERVQLKPERLSQPLSWRAPRRVFVNSVSDLFHKDVPDDFLDRVFAVMAQAERHTFQILTKRAGRMRSYFEGVAALSPRQRWMRFARSSYADHPMRDAVLANLREENCGELAWPLPNVWLGVSVENNAAKGRIAVLRETIAAVRMISFEPLLEAVDPDLTGIDWAIIGGESNGREFDLEWARIILRACERYGTKRFMKQLGSRPRVADLTHIHTPAALLPDKSGYALKLRDSHGGDPAEWPEDLRVREYPGVAAGTGGAET